MSISVHSRQLFLISTTLPASVKMWHCGFGLPLYLSRSDCELNTVIGSVSAYDSSESTEINSGDCRRCLLEWRRYGRTEKNTGSSASTRELQCFYKPAQVIWLQLWQGGLKLWKASALLLTGWWEPLGKHEGCFVLLTLHCESYDCFKAKPCSHRIFGILCYLEAWILNGEHQGVW